MKSVPLPRGAIRTRSAQPCPASQLAPAHVADGSVSSTRFSVLEPGDTLLATTRSAPDVVSEANMPVSPEAELDRSFDERGIEIMPTGAALGAACFSRITRAGLDHSVILIRDQTLDDAGLIAFSRRFGELDWAPIQETGRRFVEGMPEIYVVSNVLVNGEPIGSLGAGEAVWHTDMSYLELPPKASMLYALEVPPSGGNTAFCSMYAVYDGLPLSLKRRIAELKIKHDGTYNSGGYVRQGVTPSDDPRTSPGAVHPLVC